MSLFELGWSDYFEAQISAENRDARARVVEELRGMLRVAGEYTGLADVAGRLRRDAQSQGALPAVGDWVLVSPPPGDGRGLIRRVLPRRAALKRRAAGTVTTEQVVAANVDTVFIVSALSEDVSASRLERYITMVRGGGAAPVIVLNKADACPDTSGVSAQVRARVPLVDVVAVSAFGDLTPLDAHLLPGRTAVFVGASGVGKSSIINALLGREVQAVSSVREADGKGRHTTTSRQLLVLERGAIVIDTPGTRELQPWADEGAVDQAFSEIAALAQHCRFTNCSHDGEPGCAVRDAIERGELLEERLLHYRKLARELAFEASKRDVRASLERKRRWRRLSRAQKAGPRRFEDE